MSFEREEILFSVKKWLFIWLGFALDPEDVFLLKSKEKEKQFYWTATYSLKLI